MIKSLLYRWLLKRLIANACEARIPRSGSRGEQVDCYVVAVDRNEAPYFIATAISGEVLGGLLWDGSSYSNSAELTISDLDAGQLNITHYYGLSEIVYDNIYGFAWHYFTRMVYIRIWLCRRAESTNQYFFNKRKLVTKRRMELLRLMMDDQLDRAHEGVSLIRIMERIYSMRMFLHPSWEAQHRKVELYLDSLVQSGELALVNGEYVVTGLAISTIERYEEEERRHAEAVRLQRKMFWLTLVAVIFAVVQSGFVKLPTIIDLSKIG